MSTNASCKKMPGETNRRTLRENGGSHHSLQELTSTFSHPRMVEVPVQAPCATIGRCPCSKQSPQRFTKNVGINFLRNSLTSPLIAPRFIPRAPTTQGELAPLYSRVWATFFEPQCAHSDLVGLCSDIESSVFVWIPLC